MTRLLPLRQGRANEYITADCPSNYESDSCQSTTNVLDISQKQVAIHSNTLFTRLLVGLKLRVAIFLELPILPKIGYGYNSCWSGRLQIRASPLTSASPFEILPKSSSNLARTTSIRRDKDRYFTSKYCYLAATSKEYAVVIS